MYRDLAATGQEALDLFYKNSYHAIFMDVGLPDQNGVEVIQTLRAHEVLTQTPMTPVIILTAYDIQEIKQQCDCLDRKPSRIPYCGLNFS